MYNVKERNIALCIIFTFITCGIYGIYWFVTLTDDMNAAVGENGTSGVKAFVFTLITCSIYGLYWAYKMGEKVDTLKIKNGQPTSNNGVIYLILFYLTGGLITYALLQNELNKVATA